MNPLETCQVLMTLIRGHPRPDRFHSSLLGGDTCLIRSGLAQDDALGNLSHGFPWSGRNWQVFPIHAICSQDLRAATSGRFPVKSGAEAHIWGFPCRWCHQEYLPIWRPQKATREIGVSGLFLPGSVCCGILGMQKICICRNSADVEWNNGCNRSGKTTGHADPAR